MDILERYLSAQVVERLGWTLIHFVWQGAVIALLLAVVLKALNKRNASTRYIVACTALVLVVAMPLVTMQFVEVSGPPAEAGPVSSAAPTAESLPVEATEVAELPFKRLDAPFEETMPAEIHIPWTQRVVAALEPALPYLVLGWLLGVFGLSAWHLGGWAQLQRMRCRMVREMAQPLNAKLAQLAGRLGVTRAVGLLQSALVEVPTVVGWIKPVILLPAGAMSGLTTDQLEAILAHELAHIRRYDYLVNMLQTVVEILGFYHPGLWWISQKIRDERENCCDDLAVHVTGDSVRYARALTSLEEMRHRGAELAIAAGGGNLLGRIARLLGRPAPRRGRFTWLPGLIALVLATLIVIPTALVLAAPKPTPLNTPASKPAPETPTARDVETTEKPTVLAATEAPQTDASENKPQVLIDFILAEVQSGKLLDGDTIRAIVDAPAGEDPAVRDQIKALDSEQGVTLGELLQRCVQAKPLTAASEEKLVGLLESKGYLKIQMKPRILTNDNEQAQIKIGTEIPIQDEGDPNAQPKHADLGTSVRITPHLSPTRDLAVLELGVTLNQLAKQQKPNEPPAINTKEIAIQVAVQNDRYFSLLMDANQARETQDPNEESTLVLFRTQWDTEKVDQDNASVDKDQPNPDSERLVRLDVRVVEADLKYLLNAGLEWTWPTIHSGPFSEMLWEPYLGYANEKTQSEKFLAELNRLCEQDRARIISAPRVMARNNHLTEISISEGEFFWIDPNTEISIKTTPHIGSHNDVTLDLATEIKDVILAKDPNKMPTVTRRTRQDVRTVQDGGTIALPGTSPQSNSRNGGSTRKTLILITVHVLSDKEAAELRQENGCALSPATPTDRVQGSNARASRIEPNANNRAESRTTTPKATQSAKLISAKAQYINSDPLVGEMSKKIVELEMDLASAEQKFLPEHPEIVQKKAMLATLKKRLKERREELAPVLAEAEQIVLNGELTLTNVLGFKDQTYRDGYIYQVPVSDETKIAMESVHVADGQAALRLIPWVPGLTKHTGQTKQTQPLLVLVTATRTQIDAQAAVNEPSMPEDFPPQAMGSLPGGFGGFAPGVAPPVRPTVGSD